MNYSCTYNEEHNIIEAITHGDATVTGLLDMLRDTLELYLQNSLANILIDHSDLDVSQLSMQDISMVSKQSAEVNTIIQPVKCAHIAEHSSQVGLIRAWEIMLELNDASNYQTQIFKNRSDALHWLKADL